MAEESEDSFDEEDFDERIPWSLSYVAICILLPLFAGLLNGFVWSGYSLYVRSMGWSLPMAGLGVSLGSLARLPVQQVIFRAGIWTCTLFAALQTTIAVLAVLYVEEAAVIFTQVGSLIAFDVTIAIEGITFDTWSDSEVQVSQAQSCVLSTFTLAYALAATLGGVIYDFGGWSGMAIFHTFCASAQLLLLGMQPAIRKSFWAFVRPEEEEEEDDDDVKELGDVEVVSIVPSAPSGAPSAKTPEDIEATLPGALLDELEDVDELKDIREEPDEDAPEAEERAALEAQKGTESQALRNSSSSAKFRRGISGQSGDDVNRRGSARARGSMAGAARGSMASAHGRARGSMASAHGKARGSMVSTASGPSASRMSVVRLRQSRMSRMSGVSRASGVSRMRGTVGHRGSRMSRRSRMSTSSAMSVISRFTMTNAGEHFQYNYGITNNLRPEVASQRARIAVQSDEEDDEDANDPAGRASVATEAKVTHTASRRTTVKKSRISKDMYLVALYVALFSFNSNTSYSVEWTTFAIYFKEHHGWDSATWAGIAQTSGDIAAAIIMGLAKGGEREPLEDLSGVRWFVAALTSQPYNLAIFACTWSILNAGLCIPVLPVAVSCQVLMGTLYVFSMKAVSDLNLFYSLGDSQIFLQLQVFCRNADAIGTLVSGYFAMILYEINPIAPYLCCSGVSFLVFLVVVTGFCRRIGFGRDIETAEAQRSRRLGLKRTSTWKSQSRRSMRQTKVDLEEMEETETS